MPETGSSSYPAALDTGLDETPSDPEITPLGSAGDSPRVHDDHHGDVGAAVQAVQGELGLDPAGNYTTVRARLESYEVSVAPTTSAVGDSPDAGDDASFSRTDHRHGREGFASPGSSAVGDTVSAGVATTVVRSDHRHGREGFGSPASSAVGDSAADGVATTVIRSDHKHAREGFGAVTAAAYGDASANGAATSVARSDHNHGLPDTRTIRASVATYAARTSRTAGDLTLNSTVWANVDTNIDITLSAATGNWIEVGVAALFQNEAVNAALDVVSVVAGSPVNAWGNNTTPDDAHFGVLAWYGPSGQVQPIAGSMFRALVAGDISSGTVTLRLRYRTTTAANKTLFASSTVPLVFFARNHG